MRRAARTHAHRTPGAEIDCERRRSRVRGFVGAQLSDGTRGLRQRITPLEAGSFRRARSFDVVVPYRSGCERDKRQ
jgi:hypothetical protein